MKDKERLEEIKETTKCNLKSWIDPGIEKTKPTNKNLEKFKYDL